jgi:hypothetical protein
MYCMLSTDTYYDCLLVACMRRVQSWSYLSVLAEFRQNIWPNKMFDFEQFIEHFNITLIDLSSSMPDFITIHDNFKVLACSVNIISCASRYHLIQVFFLLLQVEEFKLLERCAQNEAKRLLLWQDIVIANETANATANEGTE